MDPSFGQKNCAHNWDPYLNRCVLKREIVVVEGSNKHVFPITIDNSHEV